MNPFIPFIEGIVAGVILTLLTLFETVRRSQAKSTPEQERAAKTKVWDEIVYLEWGNTTEMDFDEEHNGVELATALSRGLGTGVGLSKHLPNVAAGSYDVRMRFTAHFTKRPT